jgi:pimeloyl-ACP methyl ester carboxylesterase
VALLAADLRGRGHSADLPGPYGIDAHVADLLAVLDDAGVERVVLVGHSLGCYVAAGLATLRPERVAGLVLVDGGLVVPSPPPQDIPEVLDTMIEMALTGVDAVFDSVDDYAESWKSHPALAWAWDDDIEAYVRYNATNGGGAVHSAVVAAAVRADLADLAYHERARTAIERVTAPIRLLRAGRGILDDPYPVIPGSMVDGFLAVQPDAHVETVPAVNHYTIALGAGPGPGAVTAALVAAVRDAT